MMYHEIKFSCKQITSSEDTAETKSQILNQHTRELISAQNT